MTYHRPECIDCDCEYNQSLVSPNFARLQNGRLARDAKNAPGKLRAVKESASLLSACFIILSHTVPNLSLLSSVDYFLRLTWKMFSHFKFFLLIILLWKSHSEAKSLKRDKRQVVVPGIFNIDGAQVTEVILCLSVTSAKIGKASFDNV